MTLRPGGGPACLLLELWEKQAMGTRESLTLPSSARRRLQELHYLTDLGGWMSRLTPAGREAARVLEASTGAR